MKKILAIDIGASSGRHIIGYFSNGELTVKDVYRFNNYVKKEDGNTVWNIPNLVEEVKKGIDIALEEEPDISSLSIDTWAVDYVLLKGNKEVPPYYSYRDKRTEKVIGRVHNTIPFSELYKRTGIQFQPFNTIYQLTDDLLSGRLKGVTDFLMIPEYIIYKLTGVKVHEYTNATTTGMLNVETKQFDPYIIKSLGLPDHLFPDIHFPGKIVGKYKGINVVLTATHDTGSAVEGIPMEDDSLYISSGTWSLLGVKTKNAVTDEKSRLANFSNEGGVGYVRYQKNIMGMWLANELRRELCPNANFPDIVKAAEESCFDEIVDANDSAFLSPKSMKEAFDKKLTKKPQRIEDYFRVAYRSLALSYAEAVKEIEENTNKEYKQIYIVGGGANNDYLNRLTEEATGKKVIALPIEATAQGNLSVQLRTVYNESIKKVTGEKNDKI